MSPPTPEAALRARIARFIDSYGEQGDRVALALDLWAWQVAHNPYYRRICAGSAPRALHEIPAVPVQLFRELVLTSFPLEDARVTFRTSGTTGGRGVVRLRDTDLYDRGARLHAERVVGPIPARGASLVPHAPDSSLGHMCRAFSPGLVSFFDMTTGVDAEGLCRHLADHPGPAFVPGTAFAFAALLDADPAPMSLPPGSLVMVTGGFKGRRVAISEADLITRLDALFPGTPVVGEYGMSELSSQLWAPKLGEPFQPPPWLVPIAVDPVTGAPVEAGLLRFIDLASVDTVLAIETGDLGEVAPDGAVRLLGRHAGSPLRGCSLTVEEALRPPADPTALGAPAPLAPRRAWTAGPTATGDADRIDRVLAALERLGGTELAPLAQGLSAENAAECFRLACEPLSREALQRALAVPGRRPPDVTIAAAWGVFTSPLEWVALYAAAGMAVHLKAPSRDPAFCEALAAAFSAEGLPCTASPSRALGAPSAVVAFGSDQGVADVVAATPGARHLTFGHRFSVGVCEPEPWLAEDIARAHALYDTRGCMAPVAIFCLGDPAPLVRGLQAVLDDVEEALPSGAPEPALGPEIRRREALARATGRLFRHGRWRIAVQPVATFTPAALPRFITLHPVSSVEVLDALLARWEPWLSTLGTDEESRDLRRPADRQATQAAARAGSLDAMRELSDADDWATLYARFPRVVPLERMQQPALGRLHDGHAMLGDILDPPKP